MADNVTLNSMSGGEIVATDQVGTDHYQRIKIDGGGDGVSVPIIAGQQLAAGSVPVVLTAAQITTLTPPAAITGFATSTLQGGGLPAALGAGGGLKVDGSGTALPVTGTITAVTNITNAVAVTNAGITTIAGAVAGTEMQVDVLTMPTTTVQATNLDVRDLTSVSDSVAAVCTNTGTFATQATLAAETTKVIGTVNISAAQTIAAVTAITNALPAGANVIGSLIPNQYELAGNTLHVNKYYTNEGAVTDGIVWSPAVGKRWYVTDITINVSAACTVTIEDDLTAGDNPVWKAEFSTAAIFSKTWSTPLFSGEDAADLLITTTAGNVYVTVTGYEV